MIDLSGITHTVVIRGKFHDLETDPTYITAGIHDLAVGEAVAVQIWHKPSDDFLDGINAYQQHVDKLFFIYRGHGVDLDTREVDECLEYIVIRIR